MKTRLNIPIDLCCQAVTNNTEKPLIAYAVLNLHSDGILTVSEAYCALKKVPGYSSRNSQKKYLYILEKSGFIGWDHKTDKIYIRSISSICSAYRLSPVLSMPFTLNDLQHARDLIHTAVIAPSLKKQKAAMIMSRRKRVSAAEKSEASQQKPYPGLSLETLSKMWVCSKSDAAKRKARIEKAGFISTIPHRKKLGVLQSADYNLRKYYQDLYNNSGKGIHFTKDYDTGQIWVLQQMCDEIVLIKPLKRVRSRSSCTKQLSSSL